jgi:ApaG protein
MYTVEIANVGKDIATLRSRHWVITDANGRVEEVRGEGVVGKQPRLGPGEKFEYTSWAMLRTPFGTMRGSYQMLRPDGQAFDAKIGEFALTQPHALH